MTSAGLNTRTPCSSRLRSIWSRSLATGLSCGASFLTTMPCRAARSSSPSRTRPGVRSWRQSPRENTNESMPCSRSAEHIRSLDQAPGTPATATRIRPAFQASSCPREAQSGSVVAVTIRVAKSLRNLEQHLVGAGYAFGDLPFRESSHCGRRKRRNILQVIAVLGAMNVDKDDVKALHDNVVGIEVTVRPNAERRT